MQYQNKLYFAMFLNMLNIDTPALLGESCYLMLRIDMLGIVGNG